MTVFLPWSTAPEAILLFGSLVQFSFTSLNTTILRTLVERRRRTVEYKEKLPLAVERYVEEAKRALWVLEIQLERPEGKGYLAAGKYTIADLRFFLAIRLPITLVAYPAVDTWFQKISN